jgi:hypothetical protein
MGPFIERFETPLSEEFAGRKVAQSVANQTTCQNRFAANGQALG